MSLFSTSRSQALKNHFHLLCLVPGGVLAVNGQEWIDCKRDFLFPVKALSRVFRGKFIAYLEEAFAKHRLTFSGNTRALETNQGFKRLIKQLCSKSWMVYTKPTNEGHGGNVALDSARGHPVAGIATLGTPFLNLNLLKVLTTEQWLLDRTVISAMFHNWRQR